MWCFKNFYSPIFLRAVTLLLLLGCQVSTNKSNTEFYPEAYSQERPAYIDMPFSINDEAYVGLENKQLVISFYQQRNLTSVWIESTDLSPKADSMINFIANIRYYGLLPSNYHYFELGFLMRDLSNSENLRRIDALLTDAFLIISKDLKYGRLSRNVKMHNDLQRLMLLSCISEGWWQIQDIFKMLEPDFSGYHSLKKALQLSIDSLSENDRHAVINGAVNGMGDVGNRIKTIEVNLERWRWENINFGLRYVYINLPSSKLQVMLHDETIFESRILIGKPETPTPISSGRIDCFVIYPYWQIPKKHAIKYYLPAIQNDTSFLSRNGLEVLDKSGNRIDHKGLNWLDFNKKNFPFKLRQLENADVMAGSVDLMVIENPYVIYLNNDGGKKLYEREDKTVTEGNIRVEKAYALANVLLTGEASANSAALNKNLKKRQRNIMELYHPFPVHVRYFTCEFKDNMIYQYKDIYHKDQRILALLYKQNIPKMPDFTQLH